MRIQPLLLTAPTLPAGPIRVSGRSESAIESSTGSLQPAKTAGKIGDSLEISDEARNQLDLELDPEEQQQVAELKKRDREVRAHEQAHLAAAGPYASGGPTYQFETGPDGNRYAVGGEVQIDTSPIPDDPEATIEKARVVRAAALAPAEPSSQDRAVAAAASQMEAAARAELAKQRRDDPAAEPSAEEASFETSSLSQSSESPPSSSVPTPIAANRADPFAPIAELGKLLNVLA